MSDSSTRKQREPIAVVGIGSLYPGAHDLQTYWQTITEGRDKMQQVPAHYWLSADFFRPEFGTPDRVYTDRGAFIDPIDLDVLDTGVTPNNLSSTDVSQLLGLHVAKQVLRDAGFLQDEALRARTSVILGVSGATDLMGIMSGRLGEPVWRHALQEAGLPEVQVDELVQRMLDYFPTWKETTFPGMLGNVIAGRIANRLDLHGTNCVVDAACASSFSALSMAMNELRLHQSDLVLTGGIDALNHPLMYMCFAQTGALSLSGDCRPFSDQADGTMMGEGIGMLALRRLADAERDGNSIYAVIRACGSSSDGLSKSVYAPVAAGQAIALQRAYAMAGYAPQTVELVEAHGTATVAGDAAEFAGLNTVFKSDEEHRQWCALGSVKSQIGHTKGAAGAAGLIKIILALQQKVLPPTIKVERLNPKLDIANSPFYINTQTRPWVRDARHPRRASASALGFGGSNFHVAVEEYTGPGQRPARLQLCPIEAVLIGAADRDDAMAQCRQLRDTPMPAGALRHLAYTTQHAADLSQPIKLVVLAKDETALQTQLDKAMRLIQQQSAVVFEITDGDVFISSGVQAEKTALLFPGQGSQYLGMGTELAMFAPAAQAVWDRAATALADRSPHHAVFPPPAMDEAQRQAQEQFLRRAEQAQPALGVCALANWQVLKKLGLCVDALAGHSFGEVTALHAAGVFDESALFNIAATRGRLMAEAAQQHQGAMSAVIGDKALVKQIVATLGDGLVIANDNSPTQCVISGGIDAIQQAEQQLQQQGLRVIRLPVASAFHSSIVADAGEPFLEYLKDIAFNRPALPVIACSNAKPYTATAATMRKTLAEQLARPVRFVEQLEQLYAMGVRNFVEVGSGNVLSKLVNECLHERPHRAIACDQKNQHGVVALYKAMAALSIAACQINWAALWDGVRVPRDPADASKPQLSKAVAGHNLDRPYPPPPGAAALHGPMDYFIKPRQEQNRQQEVSMKTTDSAQDRQVNTAPPTTGTPVNTAHSDVHHVLLAAQQQYQASMQAMQQSMTDAHLSYLQAVQGLLGGAADAIQVPARAAAPAPVTYTPPPPMRVAPVSTPTRTHAEHAAIETPTAVLEKPPVVKTAPAPVPVTATGVADVVALFLDVVADKTGYPREVLELDMEMESGLGIDSIKRVEILAELQQQLPDLVELDATQLASLATLREVVNAVEQSMGQTRPLPTPSDMPVAAANTQDIVSLFLDVVADKTGYPREVLELDMEMESGLGIDSIKRVEILAELQKQLPDLGELDATQLASLSTLREVVESVQQSANAGQVVEQAIERAKQPEKKTLNETQHRHVLRLGARVAPGFITPGMLQQGVIAITGDDSGVADELTALLRASGLQAIHLSTLDNLPDELIGLIALHGLHAVEHAEAGIDQQIAVVKTLQQAADRLQTRQGFLLLAQAGGGDFGLRGNTAATPWNRGLAALARTARLEWPAVTTRFIDCDRHDANLAQTLFDELWHGADTAEIAIDANGRRTQLMDIPQAVKADTFPLSENAVVLVAGGGRGVTAACMIELARQQRLRFALLGRSELIDEPANCRDAGDEAALIKILSQRIDKPDLLKLRQQARAILAGREIRHTLQQIQSAGSEAQYYCTDIQEPSRVEQTMQQVRAAWGEINGLIHAAGVLADKRIVDKTEQQLSTVMQTKLRGIEVLLNATQQAPLQLIVMFSSVAARYGNIGQCDYAMANEVLNQLALSLARQRPGCRVKSLMWGPWDGGMVTPQLKKHFADMQVPLIDMQAGASWFVDELKHADEVLVVLGEGRELSKVETIQAEQHHFDVLLSAQQQPYLIDHAINGKVVLPMAQVIEWFMRAAHQLHANAATFELEDFQVLSGIKLDNFAEQALRLQIELKDIGAGRYAASLHDALDKPCYRATLIFDVPPKAPADHFAKPTSALTPWSIDTGDAYGEEMLFHGPAFRVIHELGSISDDGCVLQLDAGLDQTWHGAPFLTHPALLDGCLQAPVLWGQCQHRQKNLPISIKRIQWFRPDGIEAVVSCYAAIHTQQNRLQSDILVVDARGQALLALHGVENIVYAVKSEAV